MTIEEKIEYLKEKLIQYGELMKSGITPHQRYFEGKSDGLRFAIDILTDKREATFS